MAIILVYGSMRCAAEPATTVVVVLHLHHQMALLAILLLAIVMQVEIMVTVVKVQTAVGGIHKIVDADGTKSEEIGGEDQDVNKPGNGLPDLKVDQHQGCVVFVHGNTKVSVRVDKKQMHPRFLL